jgi:hypothetical protein
MVLLRALAIASNVAFIGYGLLDGLWPILVLHSAMLPINIRRYRELVLGHCDTATADAEVPLPSKSTLLGNLIEITLGLLRSWRERGIEAMSLMFGDGFGDLERRADQLRRLRRVAAGSKGSIVVYRKPFWFRVASTAGSRSLRHWSGYAYRSGYPDVAVGQPDGIRKVS